MADAIVPDTKDWTWVLLERCPECGLDTRTIDPHDVGGLLRANAASWRDVLTGRTDEQLRTRPSPATWSALEYACHVRDVLWIQRERIEQAQREDEPTFTPMRRDERVVEERYNEQDPGVVAAEIVSAGEALMATLDALDDAGWQRTGIYSYPEPATRIVEWIAVHTVHELLHHRVDIGTLA